MSAIVTVAFLLARFTVIVPHDGQAAEFEAGYRRHLEWHRAKADPWPWYGWTIVSGERLGVFVDATIDRTAEELDTPVDPAGDRADNERNVAPYGRFAQSSVYRRRPDLCDDPGVITEPFATMVTLRIRAGESAPFERRLKEANLRAYCFELLSGGDHPSYLILKPARSLSAAATWQPAFAGSSVSSLVTETLRYREDLTYLPEVTSDESQ